jgi:Bacterial EndoU nuclease
VIQQRKSCAAESQFEVNMNTNYEIFANNGLSNIFDGSLREQIDEYKNNIHHTRVVGFRFESAGRENIKVIPSQPEDKNGVYTAKVLFDGVRRKGSSHTSAFFPKHWTQDDVIKAVAEAYENKVLRNNETNKHVGKTQKGMQIILWLDNAGKILDAMPVQDVLKPLKNKKKLKGTCQTCGKTKHRICLDHNTYFPKKSIFKKLYKRIRYRVRRFYFNVAKKAGLVN